MFDFKVQHILRKKYTAADRLLQRLQTESNNVDKWNKTDIKEFINAELGALSIALVQANVIEETAEAEAEEVEEGILKDRNLKDLQKIALFLTTLKKLSSIS